MLASAASSLLRPSLLRSTSSSLLRPLSTSASSASTAWVPPSWVPPSLPTLENRLESNEDELASFELTCTLRPWEKDGSRYSRGYRSNGLVPGIIYGQTSPSSPEPDRILCLTSHQKIQRELVINKLPGYSAMESRVYDLTIEETNETIQVIPRDLQMHPVRNEVLCLNYLRYYPGRILKVPLRYIMVDDSPALKRGAFILSQNRFVSLTVKSGSPIPRFVEVDCEGLNLKDKVRRGRLNLPEGCEWGVEVGEEWLVGSVFGRAKTMKGVEEETL